jgi:hypothetical protein
MNRKIQIIGLVLLASITIGAWDARALLFVTNRYDFEPAGGVTEIGWTHVDQTIGFTGTTAGFNLSLSGFYGAVDRLSSTQPPTSVTRDFVMGAGANPVSNPTVVFREIVPAHATNVAVTIYRSDPIDTFAPNFSTRVSHNGGSQVLVNSGLGSFGNYHAPITFNLALVPTITPGTLDFYFYDTIPSSSQVRLNGIQAIYTIPEPSTAVLLGVVAFALRRRTACKTGDA